MENILIRQKGYTLEVVSWENDGDNYNTVYKTVETIKEARMLYKLCTELFCSKHNGKKGLGNSMEGEGDKTIKKYIEENPELDLTRDKIYDLSYELMSSSEYYDFRVCESVTVTYLVADVYATSIKF